MILERTKLDAQLAALDAWAQAGGIGTIVMPPRMGKTLVGCIASERHLNRNPSNHVLIITPNNLIRDQWINTLNQILPEIDRIKIYTKLELLNLTTAVECTLVIIDEIHRLVTDRGTDILNGLYFTAKFKLGLTGTYVEELANIYPIIYSVSEQEAIEKGWINSYVEYNIGVDLTDAEKTKYKEYTDYIRDVLKTFKGSVDALCQWRPEVNFRKAFNDDFDLLQSCHAGKVLPNGVYLQASDIRHDVALARGWNKDFEHNAINDEIDKYFNPNNLAEYASTFTEITRKRNEIINYCDAKLDIAIKLVDKFNTNKIISFSQSTKFADMFSERLNSKAGKDIAVTYHSKLKSIPLIDPTTGEYITYKTGAHKGEVKLFGKDSLKSRALIGIGVGKFRVLSTVASLNEGLDIPDLSVAIISSGDCNPIVDYQRKSRTKTIDPNNPDKLAYIFNIYIKPFDLEDGTHVNSRDLSKLKERQRNEHIIWITDVEQIE